MPGAADSSFHSRYCGGCLVVLHVADILLDYLTDWLPYQSITSSHSVTQMLNGTV